MFVPRASCTPLFIVDSPMLVPAGPIAATSTVFMAQMSTANAAADNADIVILIFISYPSFFFRSATNAVPRFPKSKISTALADCVSTAQTSLTLVFAGDSMSPYV